MIKRFRMIAGPNGSGKSTLVKRLREDFAVNFYDFLNADEILKSVRRDGKYSPRFPIEHAELVAYAAGSSYSEDVKECFLSGAIGVDDDSVSFAPSAVNSYTIALFTGFLQATAVCRGISFSQETVFSHPSKVDALRRAREMGYRTYLYFVSTCAPQINLGRVINRNAQGGHDVPPDKVLSRYGRSLSQVKNAIPYLSRAYFFDNSGAEMIYLGQYSETDGYSLSMDESSLPRWFIELNLK